METISQKQGEFTNVDCVTARNLDLQDLWNVETTGILDQPNSTNDKMVKKHFKEAVKFEEGRCQVAWLWKHAKPDLPVNNELTL